MWHDVFLVIDKRKTCTEKMYSESKNESSKEKEEQNGEKVGRGKGKRINRR